MPPAYTAHGNLLIMFLGVAGVCTRGWFVPSAGAEEAGTPSVWTVAGDPGALVNLIAFI